MLKPKYELSGRRLLHLAYQGSNSPPSVTPLAMIYCIYIPQADPILNRTNTKICLGSCKKSINQMQFIVGKWWNMKDGQNILKLAIPLNASAN